MSIYGYFTDPAATEPAFDPGLMVTCPVCHYILARPVVTVSLMVQDDNRSYFYRMHKSCNAQLTPAQADTIDHVLIDAILLAKRLVN